MFFIYSEKVIRTVTRVCGDEESVLLTSEENSGTICETKRDLLTAIPPRLDIELINAGLCGLPNGWQHHPDAPGFAYKGQDVKLVRELVAGDMIATWSKVAKGA